MHNFATVAGFEVVRTFKKKSFWLSVLIVPMMLVIVFMLVYFSSQSTKKNEQAATQQPFSLVILDESKILSSSVLASTKAEKVGTKDEGIQQVKNGKVEAFFFYPQDPTKQPVEVYAKDVGLTKDGKYSAVATQLLKASALNNLGSSPNVAILQAAPKVNLTTYENGQKAPGLYGVIAPGLYLLLFYLVIILLGNQMLTSTTEEKENRVIEMILTSVSSRTLILGKIAAMVVLGLTQISLVLAPIVVALTFFREQLHLSFLDFSQLTFDPVKMIMGAVIFVLAFLLFTGLLVTIGAMMPTAKEAGGFFGVVVFAMIIPLYAVSAIIGNSEQSIVKIFSFFPLTAPITLLVRNAVGNLSTGQAIIGIGILAVSSVLVLAMAIRAFHYGNLEYEKRISWRRVLGR